MKSLGKKLPFLVVGTIAVCSVWFVLSSAPADDRGKIQNVVSRFFSLFRSSDREEAEVDLKAVLYRHGGRFQIQNNDTSPWTNVKVRISYVTEKGGKDVWVKVGQIDPGHMYNITSYNPPKTKQIDVRIWADTPSGKGFYAHQY